MLADVICYWKMTTFMALDSVPSFLLLKDVTNTCKHMRHSLNIRGNGGNLEDYEDFKRFSSFIVC